MSENIAHRKTPGRPANTGKRRDIAEELKKVALNLFAEQGYGQVTIKDIGIAANVNTAMIYYYFSDKESLCRASIEDAAEQVFCAFQKAIDKVEGPQKKIETWLETHIKLMGTIRKMVRVSIDLKTKSGDKSNENSPIDNFYNLEQKTLSEFLTTGIEKGIFRKVDVDETRRIVSTFLDGAMIRTLIRPNFDLESTVSSFMEVLLVYLAVQPDKKV
jgi:AcrR family transcriptional regulator|tara:strand:- start:1080 stop:1727 length:648 start_codon:yes stop_codon:yes gene_type:complete